MLPDLNRLKVFFHIFNEQSSTGAAKRLHITQSGVSQHLKKLEEELQTELFTRVNRRLIPTAAGKKLYGIVQGFMSELEQGVRHINDGLEMPSGPLRIGAPIEFGKIYLPPVFGSFRRKYPKVTMQLELDEPKVLFEKVAEGELDFAYIDILPFFMNTPGGTSAYSIEPVVREEFVLACSKKYYRARVNGTDYDQLKKLNFIGYKDDIALFRSWFKLHFEREPQQLNLVFIADSSEAIVSAIKAGLGAGITVSHLMNREIATGEIIAIRPDEEKLQNTIACVQFKDKQSTITEKAFQEHLRLELNKNYAKLELE
ncbi:LysR family transcriptional regulator [Desulfovibrio sp. JC022]|uniref:LysR family transcriptional regulator n=1 Tax=Desulfovibrio sp. JC022 TaxID=2593642 RepID=UPI0013CFAC73|nr:LysR family transcriptional regulator [Desulfovibrio sp. JC022]NDV24171.1 LysR family transcriptional regulator [Desulfovibrio sp. JC022]